MKSLKKFLKPMKFLSDDNKRESYDQFGHDGPQRFWWTSSMAL